MIDKLCAFDKTRKCNDKCTGFIDYTDDVNSRCTRLESLGIIAESLDRISYALRD